MQTTASMMMNATKEQVWAMVTDIEKAQERIECIESIEILEKPASGLIGLKWKEKRIMFGKEAEETMWITEAEENRFYLTEARNSGCIYHSRVELEDHGNQVELKMSFKATPVSFMAKLMSPLMMMMAGMIKKAYLKDMEDIQKALQAA